MTKRDGLIRCCSEEYHPQWTSSKLSRYDLELAHELERLVALLNFFHRQFAQTLEAERFHAKTGQHAPVNHCFAQIVEVHLLYRAREITGNPARECVPCSGRIVDVFERVGVATKKIVLAEKQRAMFTFLDRDVRR